MTELNLPVQGQPPKRQKTYVLTISATTGENVIQAINAALPQAVKNYTAELDCDVTMIIEVKEA